MRRMRKSTFAPNMLLELENIFTEISRKAFSSSTNNNQKFTEYHPSVLRCTGDVSKMVVSTVLNQSYSGGNMELIAADTNLLIMFIYIWNSIIGQATINSKATKKQKAIKCDIGNTGERISDAREYLILVYAFGEYITTSAAYKQGKLPILKLLEKFKAAREETHVFLQKDRTAKTICEVKPG